MTLTDAQRAHNDTIHQRILTRDWRDVPAGYYAIPVHDWDSWDGTGDPGVIAYRTFRRTVSRTTKTGRTIGRSRFVFGAVMQHPDADDEQVQREVDAERYACREVYGANGYLLTVVDEILVDLGGPDTFRANYGTFTGKCGCCGRRLTDPESKLRGIGPECRGDRKH